jgi:hypothetical protein
MFYFACVLLFAPYFFSQNVYSFVLDIKVDALAFFSYRFILSAFELFFLFLTFLNIDVFNCLIYIL